MRRSAWMSVVTIAAVLVLVVMNTPPVYGSVSNTNAPNRVRDFTMDGANNSTFGTESGRTLAQQ